VPVRVVRQVDDVREQMGYGAEPLDEGGRLRRGVDR
jgi:hypothetical protein